MLFFSILLGSDNARQALQGLLDTTTTGPRRSVTADSSARATRLNVDEEPSTRGSRSTRTEPGVDMSYLLGDDEPLAPSRVSRSRGDEAPSVASGRRGAAVTSSSRFLATQRNAPVGSVVDANVRRAVKSGALSVDKYFDDMTAFVADAMNQLKRAAIDLMPVVYSAKDRVGELTKSLFQETFADDVMSVARVSQDQLKELEDNFLTPIRGEAEEVIKTMGELEEDLTRFQEESNDAEVRLAGKDLNVLKKLYADVKEIDDELNEITVELEAVRPEELIELRSRLEEHKLILQREAQTLKQMMETREIPQSVINDQKEKVNRLKEDYKLLADKASIDVEGLEERKQELTQSKASVLRKARGNVTQADYNLYLTFMQTSDQLQKTSEKLAKTKARAIKMKAEKALLVDVIKALKANSGATARVEVRGADGKIETKVQALSDLIEERFELVKDAEKTMMSYLGLFSVGEISKFLGIGLKDKGNALAGIMKAEPSGVDLPKELKIIYPVIDLLSIRSDDRSDEAVRMKLRDLNRVKVQLEQKRKALDSDDSLTNMEVHIALGKLDRDVKANDNEIEKQKSILAIKQEYEDFMEGYRGKEEEMIGKVGETMRALNYNSQALRQIFGGTVFTVPAGFQKVKDLLSESEPLWGKNEEFELLKLLDSSDDDAAAPSMGSTRRTAASGRGAPFSLRSVTEY